VVLCLILVRVVGGALCHLHLTTFHLLHFLYRRCTILRGHQGWNHLYIYQTQKWIEYWIL
jgi:hypothetical protein